MSSESKMDQSGAGPEAAGAIAVIPVPVGQDNQANSGTHPLLIDQVLLNLFSYFENDTKNLGSFREVCTQWKSVADKKFKKCAMWEIGGADDKEYSKNEAAFIELVSKSKSDIFRNFAMDGLNAPTKFQKFPIIRKFQETVCPLITNLVIPVSRFSRVSYLNQYVTYMNNVEVITIMLNELRHNGSIPALQGVKLPKLKQFNLLLATAPAKTIDFGQLQAICHAILRAASNLEKVLLHDGEGSLKSTYFTKSLLKCKNSLTSVTSVDLVAVIVNGALLRAVTDKCPNLKKFGAKVSQIQWGEAIQSFLTHFGPQLEELTFAIHYNDIVPEYVAENEASRPEWPPFPNLRELNLLGGWQLQNNFNFQMPKLRSAHLELQTCNLPFIWPIAPLENVEDLQILMENSEFPNLWKPFGQAELQLIGGVFPNVQKLETAVGDEDSLRAIITKLPKLRELDLGHCNTLTEADVGTNIPRDRQATLSISVTSCGGVEGDSLCEDCAGLSLRIIARRFFAGVIE